jgi:hypothetical protein
MQNLCSCPNALFWCTKVAKHPFYSIRTKMMFGIVSEHFANLRHVKRCKTYVRTQMHYFRVPKLWSIHSSLLDPTWCLGVFWSILLTFDTKKMKNLCFVPECTISGYQTCEGTILHHCNKMMFGSVSEHFANLRHVKRCKTYVRTQMHYFRVPKLWSIHSSLWDPTWCLGVFWSILLTFDTKKDEKLVFRAWMHYFGVPNLRRNHSTPWEQK